MRRRHGGRISFLAAPKGCRDDPHGNTALNATTHANPAPTRPRPRRAASFRAAAALSVAAALSACAAPLPGLGPEANRVPVDVGTAPWRSLGLVETAAGGRCTGALVSPGTVLTAAHCLIDPRTTRTVDPGSVRFTLAASPAGAAGEARVRGVVTGPGFSVAPGPRPDPKAPPDSDWAVLLLDRPLGSPALSLSLEAGYLPPGTPLAFGGYQADRDRQMVADTGCIVSAYARDPGGRVMLQHSCAATMGASGGPLLARRPDGGWVVAGVGSLAEGGVTGGWAVPTASIARVVLGARPPAPAPERPNPERREPPHPGA